MLSRHLIPFVIAALPQMAVSQSYDDLARADILTGWRTAQGDHVAALQITLQPGWVTYWRAPGDAGIPPRFTFDGSAEISKITPQWPTPQVFGSAGMLSIGYFDQVTVPLTIALAPGTQGVTISGEIEIGVCEEICIPVTLPFSADLPPSGAADSVISSAIAAHPMTADEAGVRGVSCSIAPNTDGMRLTAQIAVPQTAPREHVVIETADPSVWVSEADVTRQGGQISATVDMVHPGGTTFAVDRSGVRITLLGGTRAVDIKGCSAG